MKNCIHCGAELHDGASFCHICAKSQTEKQVLKAPKTRWKKILRGVLALVVCAAIILAVCLLAPKEDVPAEPIAPADPAEPVAPAEPAANIFESDGAELMYKCEEGSYRVLVSYSRLVTTPQEMAGMFRNDQTVAPGTHMFMPSFVFVLNEDSTAFVEDEFETLVKEFRVIATPAEGSAAMEVGLPELHPDVPEVLRACFNAYSEHTFDTDICWEIEMLNGDILRLHQNLIVNTLPTAEYHYADYPMNTIDELRSLLDTIRSEHSPDTKIILTLPPVVYEGGITLDSHIFSLTGTSDGDSGVERTTFLGTVTESSPNGLGGMSSFSNLAFKVEGGVGLRAEQTVEALACVFEGCDVGVSIGERGWLCPNDCVFRDNGAGIEINNLVQAKSMTYAFRNHIFENNGAAMRINSCSYPYTFTFEGSVFRGNGVIVENLCDHPTDLSGAVVE